VNDRASSLIERTNEIVSRIDDERLASSARWDQIEHTLKKDRRRYSGFVSESLVIVLAIMIQIVVAGTSLFTAARHPLIPRFGATAALLLLLYALWHLPHFYDDFKANHEPEDESHQQHSGQQSS
jgi:hypothetical protein